VSLCPIKYLSSTFFDRPTEVVARNLLGKMLVRILFTKLGKTERLSGIIVETEAYGSKNDPASHAYRGISPRNVSMFGQVGRAYIYFTYGNHYCLNVCARSNRLEAGAVLIRALEPVEGIGRMEIFRKSNDVFSLTSGPGKLTEALDITRRFDGEDMTNPQNILHIEHGLDPSNVVKTARIGISRALNKKWRFVIGGEIEGRLSKYASRRTYRHFD
jgi:DNA-3-methyladenine glycosylase